MSTHKSNLKAFLIATDDGRTTEPLDILGEKCLVKLRGTDTGGATAVFHLDAPPMTGPPLHSHSREDEWFYVLEGELIFEIDGNRSTLGAGGSAFAPRGTAHTYQNFGPAKARLLVMVTPAGFDRFFGALSALNKPLPAPDLARTEQLMNDYGMELLGPPLS